MLGHVLSRQGLRRLAELFALTGFVIAQPLLDVFGKGSDVFIFRQAGRGDILQLVAIFVLVPPLLLWGLEAIVGLIRASWARWLHVGFVGGLFLLLAIQLVKGFGAPPAALVVAIALLAAVGMVVAYLRWNPLRTGLTYAVIAPVVFAMLFIFTSPVSKLVLPQKDAAVDRASGGADTASVVMLVLDEFPVQSLLEADGTIDAGLYPNFAALAKTSHFYRNYTTNAWYTPFAVPAVLTGLQPSGDKIPHNTDYPNNLFTVLGDDYHRNVHELLHLCPSALCTTTSALGPGGLRPLLDDADDALWNILSPKKTDADITTQFTEDTAVHDDADEKTRRDLNDPNCLGLDCTKLDDAQAPRFTKFLDSLDGTHAKSVNFLHILLPHAPWRVLPSGATYHDPGQGPGLSVDPKTKFPTWDETPRAAEMARQRHLLQVRYLDGLIGQLVARLKASKMWDQTTLVVTADHGISFMPGEPKRDVTERNYADIAWVPLFVKTPGQTAGAVSDENAQAIDVVPTIADALGIELTYDVDGRSLLGDDDRPLDEERVLLTSPKSTMRVDGVEGVQQMRSRSLGALVSPRDPELRLFQIGELGELVGRRVSDLTSGAALSAKATMQYVKELADVQSLRLVPAFAYGTLSGGDDLVGKQIAVAVNGTIGTVGPAFELEGKVSFGGMVPDKLFRTGRNEVRVYLVEPGAAPTLRPLAL